MNERSLIKSLQQKYLKKKDSRYTPWIHYALKNSHKKKVMPNERI